ncbi:hypothetical protein GGR56DRAFT_629377 [Xylariaceae sp. FL0804]|nr:hypothetical protein GGR56DRAFT_629377 [Xylariaceae sp. FL0804]
MICIYVNVRAVVCSMAPCHAMPCHATARAAEEARTEEEAGYHLSSDGRGIQAQWWAVGVVRRAVTDASLSLLPSLLLSPSFLCSSAPSAGDGFLLGLPPRFSCRQPTQTKVAVQAAAHREAAASRGPNNMTQTRPRSRHRSKDWLNGVLGRVRTDVPIVCRLRAVAFSGSMDRYLACPSMPDQFAHTNTRSLESHPVVRERADGWAPLVTAAGLAPRYLRMGDLELHPYLILLL